MAKFDYSPTKQKIALLLLSGITLALSPSPRTHWYILKTIPRAWKKINRDVLHRIMREFYTKRLVDIRHMNDGTTILVLTDRGKTYALRHKIDDLSIATPARWDKLWRLVIFDIPEKRKKAREALRLKLRDLGFCQIQKSVWTYPYHCKDVIDFIVEIFEIRPYVHYIEAKTLSNDSKLKLHFKLF